MNYLRWAILLAILLGGIGLGASLCDAAPLIINWNDNSSDETSFELERQVGACGVDRHPWIQIVVLPADTQHYEDNGLAEGEVYCYRVRACNSFGCSAYSNTDGGKTRRPPKGNEFFMSEEIPCSVLA